MSDPTADQLAKWPVFDTYDFETVIIDVTKWQEDQYSIMLNFYAPNESGEPPHSGMSLCTPISGSSLAEVYTKIVTMIDLGLFDHMNVGANGTVFSEDGEEIGEINWNIYAMEDGEDDFEITGSSFKVGGNGTLQ